MQRGKIDEVVQESITRHFVKNPVRTVAAVVTTATWKQDKEVRDTIVLWAFHIMISVGRVGKTYKLSLLREQPVAE